MRSNQQSVVVVDSAKRSKGFRWTLATERFREFILPRQDQELSLNAISEGIQVPLRTVIRAIKSLERFGYLYVIGNVCGATSTPPIATNGWATVVTVTLSGVVPKWHPRKYL